MPDDLNLFDTSDQEHCPCCQERMDDHLSVIDMCRELNYWRDKAQGIENAADEMGDVPFSGVDS
jgi:hypothetical protein